MATALALGAVAAAAGAGIAYWTGPQQEGAGAGIAATVPQGSTPSVSPAGSSSVIVSWAPTTVSGGGAVDGYIVSRYDAGTGAVQTIRTACTGAVTATSCTESSVPPGSWKYAVTPVMGSNWRGAESPRSDSIATTSIDFLAPVTSPEITRAGPAGMAAGDVDNDGDTDIVTANIFAATSSVLVNNGVGEFREQTVISNGATIDAGLGRFDGDANPDLVLLYPGSPPDVGLLIIFKGSGNGTFSYFGGFAFTGLSPATLAVGNFNGDAIDDVAIVNAQPDPSSQAGTVMTFLGNPAGNDTFASTSPAQTFNVGTGATDIVHADFNGGAGDLAVTNYGDRSLSLLAGNGTGFNAPTTIAVGAPVHYLAAAHLDGDGNRDIVASIREPGQSKVRTLFGNGAGAFPTQATTVAAEAGAGGTPHAVVATDLDDDGDQDVGVANGDPNSVSVLDNHGNGALSALPTSPETGLGPPGSYPYGLLAADFDGSGFDDLAVTNVFTDPGAVPVLLNQSGAQADLSITQTDSPDPVNAGSTLTYTLTASNAGPGTPSSVKATDTLPSGVSFNATASSPSCSASGSIVTCDYGSVAPGSPESLQVAVTVGPTTPTPLSNTAPRARNIPHPTPANNTSTASTAVTPDTVPPTHAFSLSTPAGAFLTGSTLYYKGNAGGSFRLIDTLSDPFTGPASVTFPAINTTGWTHAAETVSTPSGGPYTSSQFSWIASPSNPVGYSVTGRDNANNSSSAGLTFVSDTTAPTGGSVSYTDGLVRTLSVPVSFTNGTDGGSGIDTSSGIVRRAQATLNTATQTCGTFGTFGTTVTLVGGADTSVTSGNCYQYRYLVSDRVGNQATYTSAGVARVDTRSYSTTVLDDPGLVNYWRLGESTISADSFTGTAGTLLQSRSGEIGATWATFGSSTVSSVLTDANRVRRNGTGASMYSTSGIPPSADYSVKADIVVQSVLGQDAVNVLGRIGPSGDNFYLARWMVNGVGTGAWQLHKVVNGTPTQLGASTAATLTAGLTYKLELRMVGSSISLWVNGAQLTSATDATFSSAGKAGLRLGFGGATPSPTNTTGLHADNFRATPLADDAKGSNHGAYVNEPTLSLAGAISGDSNTAVQFDGVDDHVTAARQIQDDLTIEFWFKSTQGLGTNAQWWGNAGLVDAEVGGAANDFGTSLRSDGRVVAGVGSPDVSIVSTSAGYNDGAWHHVAFTRTRATGALALYIDGSPQGTATGPANTSLNSPAAISLGRIAAGSGLYAGTLDEVALYGTVLSQTTISDHYARR